MWDNDRDDFGQLATGLGLTGSSPEKRHLHRRDVSTTLPPNPRDKGTRGTGLAQWLERRTRNSKVAGSSPCSSGGTVFFSRVNFPC